MARLDVLAAVVIAGMVPAWAWAQPRSPETDLLSGHCTADSHTAEGPIDSDLTKRRSRFYCDAAVITFLPDYKGHVMVQFSQKEAHHGGPLGFAGRLDADGQMLDLESVYLDPGVRTTVSDGHCKFFFQARHMTSLMCGMKVDETGRRTVAIVAFEVTGGG